MQYTLASDSRKKALVISHERSGTHFLMNTLAAAFGYVSAPWTNLDFELGINLHDSAALREFFARGHDRPILNIVKPDHAAGFYAEIFDYLRDRDAIRVAPIEDAARLGDEDRDHVDVQTADVLKRMGW